MDDSALRDQVRDQYAAAANAVTAGAASCCDGESCAPPGGLYGISDREVLPVAALSASLGCGNPLAVADLDEGETVLDLGSGGGVDVLLSARRVGPTGKVYGLDMTEEMLALAIANARQAGATNVEFLKGTIEAVPLPANTVDVIISNCVINLSVDKPAVFAEAYRVLRRGRSAAASATSSPRTVSPRRNARSVARMSAASRAPSRSPSTATGLVAAGFTDVTVTPTHQAADGMHSAIIRAIKPS